MAANDQIVRALDRAFDEIYGDILNGQYTVAQAKASLEYHYGEVMLDEFREWWNSDPEGERI